MPPPIKQILAQQSVQDFLFLFVRQFPILAHQQLVKFWRWNSPFALPVSEEMGEDTFRQDYDTPLEAGVFDAARTELRRLEREAGVLTSSSITIPWPPPPSVAFPGVHRSPTASELSNRYGLWVEKKPLNLRLYTPTTKLFDLVDEFADDQPLILAQRWKNLRASRLFELAKSELPSFHERLKARDAEFITPRLYLADWTIRRWFETAALEEIRFHPGQGPGAPHAVMLVREPNVEIAIYVALTNSVEDTARLRSAAKAYTGGEEHLNFELR